MSINIWQIDSTSPEETMRLGNLIGSLLKGGEIIELRADLGGGKTTFTRGLAAGLDCKGVVSSPTFTISKIYPARNDLQLHHFDFYRLSEPGIVADQLKESITDDKVITVIEWSDIVRGVLPEKRITIEFKPSSLNPDDRTIEVSYPEDKTEIFKRVETQWDSLQP